MRILPLFLLLPYLAACSRSDGVNAENPAYALAIVSDPQAENIEGNERRFASLLRQIDRECSDLNSDDAIANKLLATYSDFRDAGITIDLRGLSENLVSALTDAHQEIFDAEILFWECNDIWAMYSALRRNGMSVSDASEKVRRDVKQLVAANRRYIEAAVRSRSIRQTYPSAHLVACD